ncbi:hypothetical protein FOZ62_019647, partial [Perkinsus olseni]
DAARDVKDRMDLIMEFVESNPETVSGGWVVIDDADLAAGHDSLIAEVFKQHFVKTNPMVGLTKELADKAIAVLQQDDDECSEMPTGFAPLDFGDRMGSGVFGEVWPLATLMLTKMQRYHGPLHPKADQ